MPRDPCIVILIVIIYPSVSVNQSGWLMDCVVRWRRADRLIAFVKQCLFFRQGYKEVAQAYIAAQGEFCGDRLLGRLLHEIYCHCCITTLQWRHNVRDCVPHHQRLDCLFNRFRRRSKKTSKLRVAGLCEGDPPVAGGFSSQRANNAENASIWWRHHDTW